MITALLYKFQPKYFDKLNKTKSKKSKINNIK